MPSTSRRDAIRLLGLAGVTSVAGCSALGLDSGPNERPPDTLGTAWTPPEDGWQFRAADLRNMAQRPHEARTRPPVEWRSHDNQKSAESPRSGKLVAATPDAVVTARRFESELRLDAYDAVDGTRQWTKRVQYSSDNLAPQFGGLVDGTAYLSDAGTDVLAVDATDGTVRWRRNLYERVAGSVPERFLSSSNEPSGFMPLPFATPETVYVQSGYGIHGLAPEDGTEQWRVYLGRETDDAAMEEPYGLAITERRIWASYGDSVKSLFTVEKADGELDVQRVELPLAFPSHPVVTNDREAVLTHDITWATSPMETLAVGTTTDDVEWQFPGYAGEGAAAYSPLATDGERVFVCASHEQPPQFVVVALRAATGKLEWLHRESLANADVSVGAGTEFGLSHPAVAGDTLLVGYGSQPDRGTAHGDVIALSRKRGRVRWRTSLSVAPRQVAVTGNRLYVGGQRGHVAALATGNSR